MFHTQVHPMMTGTSLSVDCLHRTAYLQHCAQLISP